MNIGFFLVPYQRFSGAGEYYHNLYRELVKIDTENSYTIFLPGDVDGEAKKFFGVERCVDTGLPSRPGSIRVALTMANNCVQRRLPRIDLLHCFNVPLPRFKGIIFLTTYDSREEDRPETFPPFHSFFTDILKPPALKRVNQIITISDFSKQRILYHYPFCRDKVERIYLGFDFSETVTDIRPHTRPYILTVGHIVSHKNHETLIKAFNLLARDPAFVHDLIIVGQNYNKPKYLQCLREMVEYKERVVFTGRISHELKAAYYKHADLFAFPSMYEGFGLPLVEASHFGVPIVASRIPVFEELYKNPEALFDPLSPEACARVIGKVIRNDALRSQLIQDGFSIANNLTCRMTAEKTLDLYKIVLGNKKD
jgi:glycosyltransferase involved in cell wall biosynthesis